MSLPFRKLGLGGGGVKGILHIGGLRELSRHQPLVFPDGIYGVSVGSIIATYIAFDLPFEQISPLIGKYLSMNMIMPTLNMNHVTSAFSEKGVFSMDTFALTMIKMFNEVGLDIRNKKLKDAKMPLYIVSSNITKGTPTIFSNDVSVLKAILCSCCIPGIFRPQEVNNQLYVDGDVFTPCLSALIPDALVLSLVKVQVNKLTPATIHTINPFEYMREISRLSSAWTHSRQKNHLTAVLHYPKLKSDSDLSEFNIGEILEHGETQLHSFLRAQCRLEECSKCLR